MATSLALMGILGPSKDATILLRDGDVIAAALRQALADAPPQERAGLLRRRHSEFGEDPQRRIEMLPSPV